MGYHAGRLHGQNIAQLKSLYLTPHSKHPDSGPSTGQRQQLPTGHQPAPSLYALLPHSWDLGSLHASPIPCLASWPRTSGTGPTTLRASKLTRECTPSRKRQRTGLAWGCPAWRRRGGCECGRGGADSRGLACSPGGRRRRVQEGAGDALGLGVVDDHSAVEHALRP